MTFGEKVTGFFQQLDFNGTLPPGIRVMNPYREDPLIMQVIRKFNDLYYNDTNKRIMILGINPGRNGAGTTGIPFTDTKRLEEKCGIRWESVRIPESYSFMTNEYASVKTHEPSSVFVYDAIDAFGGLKAFYGKFYIGAVSPLGFTTTSQHGRDVNYNYYDSKELIAATREFIIENITRQLAFGIHRETCICLGTGKNEKFLNEFNAQYRFFKKIVSLEHPRYIMQYRAKTKHTYIQKYIKALNHVSVGTPSS